MTVDAGSYRDISPDDYLREIEDAKAVLVDNADIAGGFPPIDRAVAHPAALQEGQPYPGLADLPPNHPMQKMLVYEVTDPIQRGIYTGNAVSLSVALANEIGPARDPVKPSINLTSDFGRNAGFEIADEGYDQSGPALPTPGGMKLG